MWRLEVSLRHPSSVVSTSLTFIFIILIWSLLLEAGDDELGWADPGSVIL